MSTLRRRLQDAPKRVRTLEEKLLETKGQLQQAISQNEKLTYTLREAREHIAALREEVDKLTQPPVGLRHLPRPPTTTAPWTCSPAAARCAWPCTPTGRRPDAQRGQEVVLNESLNVVLARGSETSGEVVTLKEVLEDGMRAIIVGRADEERVVELAETLHGHEAAGRRLASSWTPAPGLLLEKLPRPEVEELVLEEVPDISYADVGGLDSQIEAITDAVELPFLHRELFLEHKLPGAQGHPALRPAGLRQDPHRQGGGQLAGQEGGRGHRATRRPARYFLNIKGPELLNKYVGETERQIRLVFQRAREKSEEGVPVIVFFDEMDSLFRTRGTGISSDMESTIVPQLLAEIDGVETLKNVIVIGASNREDLIDPAILRPGPARREDQDRAARRGGRGPDLRPLPDLGPAPRRGRGADASAAATATRRSRSMIEHTVAEMYRDDEDNRFLEVTYQNGDKEIMYFKDFSSGAMIENIVRRAKKLAIKRSIAGRAGASGPQDLLDVDQAGVQGARGPAQHDQPRRLGQDLRQEGRADRLRAHPRLPG